MMTLAERNADIQILYPVHANPNVKEVAHKMLGYRDGRRETGWPAL